MNQQPSLSCGFRKRVHGLTHLLSRESSLRQPRTGFTGRDAERTPCRYSKHATRERIRAGEEGPLGPRLYLGLLEVFSSFVIENHVAGKLSCLEFKTVKVSGNLHRWDGNVGAWFIATPPYTCRARKV